ncbi:MAG TPA: hypothetical protein DC054_18255 [Blastocatellia bacterium]|nr:hypothetical protein [Blastocatellia bacterium]
MGIKSTVLLSVVANSISFLFGFGAKELIKYFKYRKRVLTGDWAQIIEDGKTSKRDLVHCRHTGDKLEGTIERLEPSDENYKSWKFKATQKNSMIFGTFWATDLRNNESYGTIQLVLITHSNLEGFYVRMEVTTEESKLVSNLKETRFRWQRLVKEGSK